MSLAALCAVAAFAQSTAQNTDKTRFRDAEQVKIDGVLVLKNGVISVESGGKIYHTPQLERYVGFLDGLKENAKVGVEGWSVPNPRYENTAFLRVIKLTLNGKEHDLSDAGGRGGFMNGPGDGRNGFMMPLNGSRRSKAPGHRRNCW